MIDRFMKLCVVLIIVAIFLLLIIMIWSPLYNMIVPSIKLYGKMTINSYTDFIGKVTEESNTEYEVHKEDLNRYNELLINNSYSPIGIVRDKDNGYVYLDSMDAFESYASRTYDGRLYTIRDEIDPEGKAKWTEKLLNDLGYKADIRNPESVENAKKKLEADFNNHKVIIGLSHIPVKTDYEIVSVSKDMGVININLKEITPKYSNSNNSLQKVLFAKYYIMVDTGGSFSKINLNLFKETGNKVEIFIGCTVFSFAMALFPIAIVKAYIGDINRQKAKKLKVNESGQIGEYIKPEKKKNEFLNKIVSDSIRKEQTNNDEDDDDPIKFV